MIKLFAKSQIINKDDTLEVTRDGCVIYVDGKPVKENQTTFNIAGNVQPMNGRDLMLVPEGDRFKEQYWLWTDCKILVNDRVRFRCKNFQVQSVQVWGSYFQSRIMNIDVGPNQ